jgi:undecaprenyl-diphosphatase
MEAWLEVSGPGKEGKMPNVLAYLADSDFRLSFRLGGWHPPRWFRFWMLSATRLGDGWLWLAAGLVLLALGGPALRVFAASAGAAALANVVQVVLKRRFRRPRPCAHVRSAAFGVAPLGLFADDRFSFPSGHTLNAFAIGTPIALQFPAMAPALLLVAASVGASRVVLGLHFVTDVLAGAVLGLAIGAGAFRLVIG